MAGVWSNPPEATNYTFTTVAGKTGQAALDLIENQTPPIESLFAIANVDYDEPLPGNTFQFASYAQSSGSRPVVAVYGAARGKHVFGGNFVGYTNGADHGAIGVEIDFGNLNASPGGTAIGQLIRSLGGNVGGQGGQTYLQFQAAVSSSCDTGILFNRSQDTPTVSSTGTLIRAGGEECARGLDLSNSKFTTTALYIPVNSGSTAAAFGILSEAQGGVNNSGSHIELRGAASSTVSTGINFRASGGNQAVAAAGTLISAGATACSVGINFASASFSNAGIAMGDNNISAGTTTGVRIGTSTTQKIGFFNAVPVVRPTVAAAATDATTTQTLVNSLRTALLGLGLAA